MEISVITNGTQKGVSRELVDSLRSQVEEKQTTVNKIQEALTALQGRLSQEQADHRRSQETAALELQRIKAVNDGLQKSHSDELRYVTWSLVVLRSTKNLQETPNPTGIQGERPAEAYCPTAVSIFG
jgi:type VI protein secretion system component VasK